MTGDSTEARFYEFMGFDPEYARSVRGYYVPFFEGREAVLDVACGRGEFLGLLAEAGVRARGVDLDPLMVRAARAAGHEVAEADAFGYLREHEAEFDGIFSAHFIEHLPSERAIELFEVAARALKPGGVLVLCTPNSASLPTLQRQFWWDATHVRLYDIDLLRFMAADAGLTAVEAGVNPLNRPGCPVDIEALATPTLAGLGARGWIARHVLGLQGVIDGMHVTHHHLMVVADTLAGLLRELYTPSEVYVRGTRP